MDFKKIDKMHPSSIGFLQVLGVSLYCFFISVFFNALESISPGPDKFLGLTIMLFLFVFSAAITGLFVFGYPVYLAINQKIKRSLSVLGHTFIYAVLFFLVALFIVAY